MGDDMTEFLYGPGKDDGFRRMCAAERIEVLEPNPATYSVLIGQTIGLSVHGAVNPVWGIPMASIGGYAISANAATPIPPDPTLPTQTNPHFHFVTAGTFTIPVTAWAPGGPISDTFTFVVQGPTGTIEGRFQGTPGFYPSTPGGADGAVQLGPSHAGIVITVTLRNPSDRYPAQYGIVQVATPQRTYTLPDGTSRPCTVNGHDLCDTNSVGGSPFYPYGGTAVVLAPGESKTLTMSDVPAVPTATRWGPVNGVSIDAENFAAYVMFQCVDSTAAGSLLVPVVRYRWGWGVQATRVAGGFTIANPVTALEGQNVPAWPGWPTWAASTQAYLDWGGWVGDHRTAAQPG